MDKYVERIYNRLLERSVRNGAKVTAKGNVVYITYNHSDFYVGADGVLVSEGRTGVLHKINAGMIQNDINEVKKYSNTLGW